MFFLLPQRHALILGDIGKVSSGPPLSSTPIPTTAPTQRSTPVPTPATAVNVAEQARQILDKSLITGTEGIFSEKDKALLVRLKTSTDGVSDADMKQIIRLGQKLEKAIQGETSPHRFVIAGRGFMERSSPTLMATRQRLDVLQAACQEPNQRVKLQSQIADIDARLVRKGDVKALEKFVGNNPDRQQALLSACQSNPRLGSLVASSPQASSRILIQLAADPQIEISVQTALLRNPSTPGEALAKLHANFANNSAVAALIANHPNAPAPAGPARLEEQPQGPVASLHDDRRLAETADTVSRLPAKIPQTAMSTNVFVEQKILHNDGAEQSTIAHADLPIPIAFATRNTQGAFFGMSNVGGTGIGFAVTAFHNSQQREGYMHEEPPLTDGSRRYLQSVSEQVSFGGGVATMSSLNVPVPISAGVNAAYTTSVTYARVVAPDENGAELARVHPPPSMVDLARGRNEQGQAVALRPNEEIAYRGSYNIGVTMGAVDPHSGFRISAGVDRTAEYCTAIRRNPGEPPTYTVQIEPDTTRTNGRVATGIGPFSVEGGGGKMHAVSYAFQMTEEAMKTFVGTNPQKLPALPDPRQALRSDGTMNTEVFNAFKEQVRTQEGATLPGVTLQSFGRTDESNINGKVNLRILRGGKARTTGASMTASANNVNLTTTREKSSTTGVLLTVRETTMRVQHGHSYERAQPEHNTLSRTYQGAQVTFSISNNKTTEAVFAARVNRINLLMDRPEVVPPALKGLHASDIRLEATATPAHIQALAAMDPGEKATRVKIRELAAAVAEGNFPVVQPTASNRAECETRDKAVAAQQAQLETQLTRLLVDVRASGPTPPLTPRVEQQLEKHQTSVEQLRLENQGTLIANYMGNDEASIAVLDRLLRNDAGQPPALVNVRLTTDSYLGRINDIGVRLFLDEPVALTDRLRTNTHMREFTNTVDKIQMLRQVRADVLADGMMTPAAADPYNHLTDPHHERAALVRQADENISLLDKHIDGVLADPAKRKQIMERIPVASSTVGGYWSDPFSGAGVYHDTFGHFDNPATRSEFMDRVVKASLEALNHSGDAQAQVKEYTELVKQIATGSGSTGIDQLFQVMNQAKRDGTLHEVLAEVPLADLKKLATRMTPQERTQLRGLVERHPEALARVDDAISLADKTSGQARARLAERQLTINLEIAGLAGPA